MTKEEIIDFLKFERETTIKLINTCKSNQTNYFKKRVEAYDMAIKSLEAWGKVEKEIDDSILICQASAQNNIWNDGELAGFLQSKDIINRNLSEVSE